MPKKNNDTTLAPSAGDGWDAWGAACGFSSWAKAADAIGITTAQMITIRRKAPRKTIRLAMDAILAARAPGTDAAESILDAWRSIAKVSGSALLAGEKKAQTAKQRTLVYHHACSALATAGNAYYELTGMNPGHVTDEFC